MILILLLVLSLPLRAGEKPLSTLWEQALNFRPELSAIRAEQRRLSLMEQAAPILPNPTFGVGSKGVGTFFQGVGKEMMAAHYLSFMQMYPNARKRRLQAERFALVRGEKEMLWLQRWRTVKKEIALAYFSLLFIREAQGVVRETDKLLKALEETALSRYEVGKGTQAAVLKIQLERQKLIEEQEEWRKEEEQTLAKLAGLLGQTEVPMLDDLPPLRWKPIDLVAADVLACANQESPELLLAKAVLQTQKNDVSLAAAAKGWDTRLGVMYMNRDPLPPLFDVRLDFQIPLYSRKKEDVMIRAEAEDVEAAKKTIAQKEDDIQSEIAGVLAELTRSQRQRELYDEVLLPQLKWTMEAHLASYSTGQGRMLDVLDTMRIFLQLRLKEKALTKKMLQKLSVIEYHCPREWLKEAGYE